MALNKLEEIQEVYIYNGYPSGNYLKQVCVVMSLWHQYAKFPVKFLTLDGLQQHDQTNHFIQGLDKLTPLIMEIIGEVNGFNDQKKSPRAIQKDICEFLCLLEQRGFLTCLGIRFTIGSYDSILPPDILDLEEMCNRPNKQYTEEEYANHPNPSILTVAARALNKHASRSSQYSSYWADKGSMNGMTEKDKNKKAHTVILSLINNC
jgi:hypothetical protein